MKDGQATQSEAEEWLDGTETARPAAEIGEIAVPFNASKMWVGEHAADGDILIYDPAQPRAAGDRVSFYSTTQMRTRVFPRGVVSQQIREVTDDVRVKRAKKEYASRVELRQAHDTEVATARTTRQREQVIQRHERYLASRNVPYQGVHPTPADRRPTKRVKCHACGIPLDDLAQTVCGVCSETLCSCGACACGRTRGGK